MKPKERKMTKPLRKEFSKPRIVLDTSPLIKLFIKEEGWEDIEKIVCCVENGQIEAAVCVATFTEIYSKYTKEGRAESGKARVQELRYAPYLKKLVISEEVAVKAGEFKGKYSVPLADALIAASAYYDRSIVISSDADFRQIREAKTMTEKELLSHLK